MDFIFKKNKGLIRRKPSGTIPPIRYNAINFNADGLLNDAIKVEANNSINAYDSAVTNAPLTVEARMYCRSAGESSLGTIVYKDESTSPTNPSAGYKFHVFSSNGSAVKLGANGRTGDGTDAQRPTSATTNQVLPLNQWAYAAFTFNEDGDNKIKIYMNGVIQSLSTQTAGTGDVRDDSAIPLYIGNRWDGNPCFDGIIREVRIYHNRALTAFEIANNYNGNITPGATCYFPFSEGEGMVIKDSISGNVGTTGVIKSGAYSFTPANLSWST